MTTGPTTFTPGPLAAAIKDQCPEVEETGRVNTALFQVLFFTNSGRFLIKKWVGADYSITRILDINAKDFRLNSKSVMPTILLSPSTAKVLFPGDKIVQNEPINMLSKSGTAIMIAGVAENTPGNTNLSFDCIGFSQDITQGKDQSYATQIYQTYIQVKPNTDIELLSEKIDNIYKKAAATDKSIVNRDAVRIANALAIYLDPLANLHLKPHYGSHFSNQIVEGLLIIALIILIVTSVNFTTVYIVQANTRAKEVGIKKVNGIIKKTVSSWFYLS